MGSSPIMVASVSQIWFTSQIQQSRTCPSVWFLHLRYNTNMRKPYKPRRMFTRWICERCGRYKNGVTWGCACMVEKQARGGVKIKGDSPPIDPIESYRRLQHDKLQARIKEWGYFVGKKK